MRMRAHFAALLYVAAIAAACSGDNHKIFRLPSQPSEPPPPPPPAPPQTPTIREITLGETINADIAVGGPPCTAKGRWPVPCQYYAFTPSADGTVTATLTWDALKTDTILLLRIENTQFEASGPPWSPIVGQVSVHAGQRYSLEVGMAGSGEVPGEPKPYVLTTTLK
jgi:hypothetical protein